jgi:hypothetical protein
MIDRHDFWDRTPSMGWLFVENARCDDLSAVRDGATDLEDNSVDAAWLSTMIHHVPEVRYSSVQPLPRR